MTTTYLKNVNNYGFIGIPHTERIWYIAQLWCSWWVQIIILETKHAALANEPDLESENSSLSFLRKYLSKTRDVFFSHLTVHKLESPFVNKTDGTF